MNHLIFVRHSQTAKEPHVPSHNWLLSKEGKEKAKELAAQLSEYEIDLIITSKEDKTRETANIIKHELKLKPVVEMDDLEETRRTSVPFFSDPEKFKGEIKNAMERMDDIVFGEESFAAAQKRFIRSVNLILKEYADKETVVVVTHGTVLSLYLEHLTRIKAYKFWHRMNMPHYYIWNREEMQLWPGISASPVRTFIEK